MDGLRLERADLQQKLNAATSEARAAQQELARERREGTAAKTALTVALADVAKLTQQRDNAWEVHANSCCKHHVNAGRFFQLCSMSGDHSK